MDGVMNLRRALYPKLLNLIIFPTEKCNFRCTYCYETFKVGKMKRPIIDGVKNLIRARIDRGTLEGLDLGWFGGEPTLALDVMLEIAGFAADLYGKGELKHLSGDTTTNGYLLTPANLEKLVSLHQQTYQISLDGFGKGHDITRRYASGAGTFSRIWDNILAAKATNLEFQITLRLHQTAENGDSMRMLVDNIESELKGDRRFQIFFKTIENLGGPNARHIHRMNKDDAGERVKVFCDRLQASGFAVSAVLDGPESAKGNVTQADGAVAANTTSAPEAAVRAAGYTGYICYAAKPNSLIVRADGRIGKCTVLLEDDRNTVGKLNPNGTVEIDSQLVSVWMRGFKSMDPIELGCPAQNLPKVGQGIAGIPLVVEKSEKPLPLTA